jgi:hypothetical protein
VRLTWSNDGHAALDSTVTATPVRGDGTTATPVPLTPLDEDGRYEATVAFADPGSWTVRITAVSPIATLEVPTEVSAPIATVTTVAPSATDATSTTTELDETPAAAASDSEDGDGPPLALILVGIVVVAAITAVVVVRARRGSAA